MLRMMMKVEMEVEIVKRIAENHLQDELFL